MTRFSILILCILFLSCADSKKEKNPASEVINKAIEQVGGDVIDNARISFQFRDKFYSATREEGMFELRRCSDKACQDTVDILNNSGFKRTVEGNPVTLDPEVADSYKNSVNSVHYFSLLPYGLDGSSVQKKIKDTVDIKGQSYYEIEVTFAQEGGGKDYEDNFMYWVNAESFTVDFLAYNYQVNEGGTRFRVAYNPREINGVRVVDYKNYKPEKQYPPLQSLDSLYLAGALDLLSVIELEKVAVTNCPSC